MPPKIGTPIVEKINIMKSDQTTIDCFPYLFINQSANHCETKEPKIDHKAIHPV